MKVECSITDCDTTVYARGWCKRHYSRWNRLGDPLRVITPVRAGVPHGHRVAEPSYDTVHKRLKRRRGLATQYHCSCGKEAQEWACTSNKNAEGVNGRGDPVRYSYSMDDYSPLCRPCHYRLDKVGV